MCWATPSSTDNSPMVLSAPGAFSAVANPPSLPDDPVAHDLAGAERHDPARSDRHFDARLRVAADALALVAQDEGPEAGDLHVLSFGQCVAHVEQHPLDHARGFRPGQAKAAMDDVGQIGTSECVCGVRFTRDPRDAK